MLSEILKSENIGGGFLEAVETIRRGIPSAVFNAPFSVKCHIAANAPAFALYICKDILSLEKTAAEISALSGGRTAVIYPKDDVLLYNKALSKHSLFRRLNGLYEIQKGARAAVATFESLLQLFPARLDTVSLKKGETADPQDVVKKLVKMGYVREEIVDSEGRFSLRGDIHHLFPKDYLRKISRPRRLFRRRDREH